MHAESQNVPISFTRLRFAPPELNACEIQPTVEAATELSLRSPDFEALAKQGFLLSLADDNDLDIQILIAHVYQESDD